MLDRCQMATDSMPPNPSQNVHLYAVQGSMAVCTTRQIVCACSPWTPIANPVGQHFTELAKTQERVELVMLPNTGHCPQDDQPDLVAEALLPWLNRVHAGQP